MHTISSLVLHGRTDAHIRSLPNRSSKDVIGVTHLPASSQQQQKRPSPAQRSDTEYPFQARTTSNNNNNKNNNPNDFEEIAALFNPRFSLSRSRSEMSILTSSPSPPTTASSRRSSSSTTTTSSPRKSRSSPGWYSRENELTLEDFALRLQTRRKRFEVYMGRCAQNLVMALISPTPLVLFLFNPMSLLFAMVVMVGWWVGWKSREG